MKHAQPITESKIMSITIRKRSDGLRILDFSVGPQWFRFTGSLVLRMGDARCRRFAISRGFLYPSLRVRRRDALLEQATDMQTWHRY